MSLDWSRNESIDLANARPRIDKIPYICYDCRRGFKLAVRIDYNDRGKKVLKTDIRYIPCVYCHSTNTNSTGNDTWKDYA